MSIKKKDLKKAFALLLACIMALLMCACGSGDEKNIHPVCGTWETEELSAFESLVAERGGSMESYKGKLSFTFTADDTPANDATKVKGKYRCAASYEENGETQERAVNGDFYAENGVLALDEITCAYIVREDTLEISNENVTFTLTKVKTK